MPTADKSPPKPTSTHPTIAELRAPLPVPSNGNGTKGTFSIYATRPINAPAHKLLKATLAHNQYSKWNTFAPDLTITSQPPPASHPAKALWRPNELQPGTVFTMRTYWDGSGLKSAAELGQATVTQVRVEAVEELGDGRAGYRVVWRDVAVPGLRWGMTAERVQEFEDVAGGGALYTTWETRGGPLAWLERLLYGRELVSMFAGWGAGLQGFVEDA
ncbi:hypothetical protein BP6252_03495 [Coleophoma cylindrospora]|uniref:Coenzyme Q-binding protein COQ10 START domain-containing protein n=1 Tax=Coleophoma cylindrospora TaxID=1849047 RepID=A0A3D8S7U7_9HELO|nr:hypothetical protein BP6252_03495 [Coleophoma cylindrospora]